jgi:peroxiredoxin Q/BCP
MSSARKSGTPRTPRRSQAASTTAATPTAAARSTQRAATTTVAVDQRVANFALPATGGQPWRLAAAKGRKLVLYFYPRDNTPGCTQEGQEFAALAARFGAAGTQIVGISRDSVASHEKFREKMQFPFALLSDVEEQVCRQFDVIRMKTLYGRSSLGVERSSFLLDAKGVLRREWRKVRVAGHAAEVLEAARSL